MGAHAKERLKLSAAHWQPDSRVPNHRMLTVESGLIINSSSRLFNLTYVEVMNCMEDW